MRRTDAEKLELIGKIQYTMRTNSMTEACKIHEVATHQYKLWCADLGKPYKPGFEPVSIIAAPRAPASGCEQKDPLELARSLFSLSTSCLIVLELPDGKTFHVQTKGTRDQVKFLQCFSDLQIDRVLPLTDKASQIERQAEAMHDKAAALPPPLKRKNLMNNSRRDFLTAAGLTLAALPLNLLSEKVAKPKAYVVIYGEPGSLYVELYDENHRFLERASGTFSYVQQIRRVYSEFTGEVKFIASDIRVCIDGGKEYEGLGLFSFKDEAEYRRELTEGRIVPCSPEKLQIVLQASRVKDIFGRNACSTGRNSLECLPTSCS